MVSPKKTRPTIIRLREKKRISKFIKVKKIHTIDHSFGYADFAEKWRKPLYIHLLSRYDAVMIERSRNQE